MANLTADDPESAKRFLLDSVLTQAQRDGVMLTDVERRMFLFSETSGETDWAANEQFEAECNDEEYEGKIAQLLQRSYEEAKRSPDQLLAWRTALEAVRDQDFYGLVMVDHARIPRPKPRIAFVAKTLLRGSSSQDPAFLIIKALIVVAVLFLLIDPWRVGLVRADGGKLLSIAVGAVALWLVGRIEKRNLLRKIK